MLDCIKNTDCYKSLNSMDTHAYLFYSLDNELNKEIALTKANELLCENHSCCGKCKGCKQFKSLSHPDLTIVEQDSIKVEDILKLQDKLSTKPVFASNRIFVILNADTMNETAQNKMLKSLEEPNNSAIFILTTAKLSKILPTVLSRLNKILVPTLNAYDKKLVSEELKLKGIDIENLLFSGFRLTECVNLATNSTYSNTIEQIFLLLENLNTTADIPMLVSKINNVDKSLFFICLMDIFTDILSPHKFDKNRIQNLKLKYSDNAVIKILPLIDTAYKYLNSNVNFSYILDNLLFNILKERFLCK